MAAMNNMFTSKQQLAAERIASYGAEQRRLKAEAADRRAAAARREAGGQARAAAPARTVARPDRYLR